MINQAIEQAASIIKQGGLVAFPTETVYGLGANAFDSKAVAKIFQVKERPFFDPLIVHIADLSMLDEVVLEVCPDAKALMHKFWPGPLTLVMKKKPQVPDLVTAGLDTVAIRMPDHPIALAIIKQSGCPIAAPSANPFGRLSPTSARHVQKYLGSKVDLIVDGGKCQKGLESTIIDTTKIPLKLLRAGALTVEAIEAVVGPVTINQALDQVSPGSLAYHYAPQTKLILLKEGEDFPRPEGKVGYLTFGPLNESLPASAIVESLSVHGDLVEAAANLFDALHRLDDAQCSVIYVKPLGHQGLAVAMMDRLNKAANTFKKA